MDGVYTYKPARSCTCIERKPASEEAREGWTQKETRGASLKKQLTRRDCSWRKRSFDLSRRRCSMALCRCRRSAGGVVGGVIPGLLRRGK